MLHLPYLICFTVGLVAISPICAFRSTNNNLIRPGLSLCATNFPYIDVQLQESQHEDFKSSEKRIFIFGLGYVGLRLAKHMQEKGWSVSGTCTNVNKALECRKEGIRTYLFDEISVKRGQLEGLQDMLSSHCVVSTIPPMEGGQDLVLEAHSSDFRRAVLSGSLKWIGYLSSTGVYGDCKGAWVDEQQAVKPDSPKTKARADAESIWRALHTKGGLPVHVFRLAGIYGPGRSAADSLVKSKEEIATSAVDDVSFISRIHVDDIVRALYASMNAPSPGEIYNVADDLPSTRFDVLSYAGRLLSYPPVTPSRDSEVGSDGRLSRNRGGSKRVDNSKLKMLLQENKLDLIYPDYRSGLKAIIEQLLEEERAKLRTASYPDTSSARKAASNKNPTTNSDRDLDERVDSLERRLQIIEERLSQTESIQQTILATLLEINKSINGQPRM